MLIILLFSLILTSGFIATKTLLFTGSIEISDRPNLNASSGDAGGNVNTDDAGPSFSGQSESSGNPSVIVWVNTSSGVYHCPKTRWYGKTKNGKYMTQKEAQSKGYRPAYGTVCG